MKRLMLTASAGFILLILMVPALLVWNASSGIPAGPEAGGKYKIKMLDTAAGKTVEMPLEEYLTGVLAAEMPAEFDDEALKAQALAARTYAVKRMTAFGAVPNPRHPDAEVCNNPAHCQAWISPAQMKSRWGKLKYPFYAYKIHRAVTATAGQVLTYNGKLIDPVYHGSCDGAGTENAVEVWGRDVPYLLGVDCKWEEDNPKNRAEQKMALNEVLRRVAAAARAEKDPTGDSDNAAVGREATSRDALAAISHTPAGRLREVKAGGRIVSGKDFRTALGLNSALISWRIDGDAVYFQTRGKGHAVGLCQYGANGMARAGKNYREIVAHYYTGTVIKKL